MSERNLTDLEYAVLGLMSVEPQSGYSIISNFEVTPSFRWSASPGSIYPMLKRLEKASYISGELDMAHETRPRKLYTLTSKGEAALDAWINADVSNQDIAEGRDVMMVKFLFAETRLAHDDILAWLERYEEAIAHYEQMFRLQRAPGMAEWSLHQLLLLEMSIMEISMIRNWIQMARHRLEVERLRADVRTQSNEE